MKILLSKINKILKIVSSKSKYLLKGYQLIRAIRLLFNNSFRELFKETQKGDICIDIGANIGDASLIFWLAGAKTIYAIEPHPIAFKELKNNLKGIKNIKLFNFAISNKNGKEKLYLHKEIRGDNDINNLLKYSQSSSILNSKNNVGSTFFEIETYTLNKFLKNYDFFPTIIKCDIEGAEYEIYEDFIEFAKDRKLRTLLIECHAKKNIDFQEKHNKFINRVKEENLNFKFNLSWH